MNRITLFCLGILGLTFLNCGVTDDAIECPPQFTGELQASESKLVGEWSLIDLVADKEVDLTNDFTDNPSVDMFSQYTDCSKDAVFIFGDNRVYSYENGSRTEGCNGTSTSGTWSLDSDELFLIVSCVSLNSQLSFNESNTLFEYSSTIDIQEVNGIVTTASVTFSYEKVTP